MLAARQPGAAAWLLSALLHVAVIAVLWWSAAPAVLHTPPPLAVELWAGGGAVTRSATKPAVAPAATPAPVSKPAPAKVAPAPVAQLPTLNSADITVKGGKPQPKPAPSPLPQDKAPARKALPPAPSKPAPATPVAKPAAPQPKPAAKAAPPRTDDLLSELDDLPPGPGKGKVTQAGGKTGSRQGVPNGQPDLTQQYGEAIRNRVRPYIVMPDGIKGDPQTTVEIILLPTLEIMNTRIVRASTSTAWDQAVLAALAQVRRMPPLPKGVEFTDVRRLTLNFRPKE